MSIFTVVNQIQEIDEGIKYYNENAEAYCEATKNGNMEEAATWLREHGIAKAVKKEGAIAAEGLCSFAINGNKVVAFELNSQTDFVAQNSKFTDLLEKVGTIIANSNAETTEDALKLECDGKSLETIILEASGVIGEKISLRRVTTLTKTDDQIFGAYKHMGGKFVRQEPWDILDEHYIENIYEYDL